MVALSCYLDDSKNENEGIFVLAGYMGTSDEWDGRFAPAWKRLINEAPHPITEFRASSCRHGTGEFKSENGWTKQERKNLTIRAVDAIAEQHIIGVGVGVIGASVSEVVPGAEVSAPGQEFDLPLYVHSIALSSLLISIMQLTRFLGGDKARIVCDSQEGKVGKLSEVFAQAQSMYPILDRHTNCPVFEHSHEVLPLQAADLLAYETYKELKSRRENPPRDASKALDRMVRSRPHFAHYLDESVFHEVDKVVKEFPHALVKYPVIYNSFIGLGIDRNIQPTEWIY